MPPDPEPQPSGFYVGVSVGQASEHSALVVNERLVTWRPTGAGEVTHHQLSFLHRFPVGTPYPEIIARVGNLLGQLEPRRRKPELVVDATGVGRPFLDAMRAARLDPLAVTITAGADTVVRAPDDQRVPKRVLAGLMQMTLQSGRLKVAEAMELTPLLRRELEGFKVRVNIAADDSFEAWRERQHDDLVLAAAVAVWAAEERRRSGWDGNYDWV